MKTRVFHFLLAITFSAASPVLADPVKLGIMAELSGTNATNGESCRHGFEVAKEFLAPNSKIGTHELSFIFGDNQGDAKTGVNEFQRLVDYEHVAAVISTRSQVVMAMNPISKSKQIPLLATVGHKDFTASNPFAWRFYPSVNRDAEALASLAIKLQKKRIATLTLQDEWTVSLSGLFEDEIKKLGGSVVFSEIVAPDARDFTSLSSRIRALKPDAVFVNLAIAQSGLAIKKLREQGVRAQLFGNLWAADSGVIANAGKENIEGLIFPSFDYNKPRYLAMLKSRFKETPMLSVSYVCYSATLSLLSAISSISDAVTPATVQASLEGLRSLKTLDDDILLQNREMQFEVTFKTIRSGAAEPFFFN